jgi:hypothetical protein
MSPNGSVHYYRADGSVSVDRPNPSGIGMIKEPKKWTAAWWWKEIKLWLK